MLYGRSGEEKYTKQNVINISVDSYLHPVNLPALRSPKCFYFVVLKLENASAGTQGYIQRWDRRLVLLRADDNWSQ